MQTIYQIKLDEVKMWMHSLCDFRVFIKLNGRSPHFWILGDIQSNFFMFKIYIASDKAYLLTLYKFLG